MSDHPEYIDGYQGRMEALGSDLGQLRFDCLELVVRTLADSLLKQASADGADGRKRLSMQLYSASEYLHRSGENIGKAWSISEPYMNNGSGTNTKPEEKGFTF